MCFLTVLVQHTRVLRMLIYVLKEYIEITKVSIQRLGIVKNIMILNIHFDTNMIRFSDCLVL